MRVLKVLLGVVALLAFATTPSLAQKQGTNAGYNNQQELAYLQSLQDRADGIAKVDSGNSVVGMFAPGIGSIVSGGASVLTFFADWQLRDEADMYSACRQYRKYCAPPHPGYVGYVQASRQFGNAITRQQPEAAYQPASRDPVAVVDIRGRVVMRSITAAENCAPSQVSTLEDQFGRQIQACIR